MFDLIVADPCWKFNDKLSMSSVKRGAESQYAVLDDSDIINLNVKSIANQNSVLALWVPSSKLSVGLECCNSWGFKNIVQTFCWVKTKKKPLEKLEKALINSLKKSTDQKQTICDEIDKFDLNDVLNFYMGRTFRNTHEIAIIATKGKVTKLVKNKSQRSVFLGGIAKHSEKPEDLQNKLDLIFPQANKLELFARRARNGWLCVGNECPTTLGQDIRDSLEVLRYGSIIA